MFGLIGRSALSTGFCLCTCFAKISYPFRNQATDIHDILDYVFNSGSAILSLSIGFNALSNHTTCTAVFATVAAVLGFAFSSIRHWVESPGLRGSDFRLSSLPVCPLRTGLDQSSYELIDTLSSNYRHYCCWCERPSCLGTHDPRSLEF